MLDLEINVCLTYSGINMRSYRSEQKSKQKFKGKILTQNIPGK